MDRLTPDSEQEKCIQQMLANDSGGVLIASEVGAGKTVIAVEYVVRSGAQRVLIVAPLGTRIGWQQTLERQGFKHPVRRIESNKAGKAAQAAFEAGESGAYLIGHAMFRRKADVWERTRDLDVAIYDEVQDVSNPQSQGWKVLKKLKATQRIAISGTWFGNKFERAWTGPRWVWWDYEGEGTHSTGDRHVDTSWHRWKAVWCAREYDPFTWDNKKVVGELKPGAWNAYLPLYIRTEAKLDVEAITEDLYVELTPKQRKAYTEMENDSLTWLKDNPLVAALPIITRTRLRQMALGDITAEVMGYDENGHPQYNVEFDPDGKFPKIDVLKEFLSNNEDEPVLIYTHSAKFAKIVRDKLGDRAALWAGETPQADREALLSTFGRPGGPKYIVAVIAALGAGVDGLQHTCHTVVWLSETEDNNLNHQALGRILRRGQKHNVRNVYIKALDTLDQGIYNRNLKTELENRASLRKNES